MLLAIDAGNTNTVFALFDKEGLRAQWRASASTQRTADEHAVWLNQLMGLKGFSLADVKSCIISSVVPNSLFHFRNLARRYFKTEPVIVDNAGAPGVEVRIDKPVEVGADRLVNSIGAYTSYGGPLIVVDSGTATTFDIVGDDGAFEGGVISPGINLSMQALHDAAAKLPRIAIERPERIIGKGTVVAMKSGIFWGYIGLIEGLIDRIKHEYGKPMKVVATGGVSSLFDGATDKIDVFDPDLTIRGLLEIYKRMRPGDDSVAEKV
ncbi:MAG: type III pantothenate kinase [Pseudomonadota bacterium]